MNIRKLEDLSKEELIKLIKQERETCGQQAILQSPEIQALKRDKERLDWLADPKNNIGIVQLPIDCSVNYLHSMRDAIDAAMEKQE